tara:strand:+ start:3932 stop:4474 length:543 start_codon:yes stop_codon:yes gene_type:complete
MEGSMSEEKQVVNESVENVTTQAESQVSPDAEVIAESKKYRKRAQEAEAREAKLMKQIEEKANAELKKQEEWKSLYEKSEAQNKDLAPYKPMYEDLVSKRKETLLNKLPENQRDKFKNKDIDVLEFMVANLTTPSSSEPEARGAVGNQKPPEDWTKLSPDELRNSWGDIVRNAISRNNKT